MRRMAVSVLQDSQYDWSRAMPKPVHSTIPWPTLQERVKHLQVSKARKKELQAFVDEFKTQLSNRKEASVNPVEPEKRRKRASAA